MKDFLKRYWLFVLMAILLMLSSCDDPNDIQVGTLRYHNLLFEFNVPDITSKVPNCKGTVPDGVSVTVVNDRDESFDYGGNIIVMGDRYIMDFSIYLPYGVYQVTDVTLTSADIPVYSLPSFEDKEVLHYADVILPLEVDLEEDTLISGKAFCYSPAEPPESELFIDLGIEAIELTSLYVYVSTYPCVSMFTVEIDAYRYPEVSMFESGLYEIAVPFEYTYMYIRAYDEEGVLVQSIYVDEENFDTVHLLDYECN